jgi:CheY-like chemotaxis protein
LVSDDNADAAESLAILLRMEGHEVQVASDGAAALKALEAFQPEFALLDVGMPNLNGHQVASRARAAPWAQSTTLVALTGWGQESDRQAAFAAGFHYHFVKPVDVDALLRLLLSTDPGSSAHN